MTTADLAIVPDADTSVNQWASRIRAAEARTVEAIIATGRVLIECRAAIHYGGFKQPLSEAGMEIRTAQRFMAIAHHPVISNTTHVSHLPTTWGTLYELSRVAPPVLEKAIAQGDVRPEMSRADAERVVRMDTELVAKQRAAARIREANAAEAAKLARKHAAKPKAAKPDATRVMVKCVQNIYAEVGEAISLQRTAAPLAALVEAGMTKDGHDLVEVLREVRGWLDELIKSAEDDDSLAVAGEIASISAAIQNVTVRVKADPSIIEGVPDWCVGDLNAAIRCIGILIDAATGTTGFGDAFRGEGGDDAPPAGAG